MAKRIYIETTIPSFYFEARSTPDMVARREWTRRWWQDASARYELVTSLAVVEELSRGDFPEQQDCLRLIESLPLVPIEAAVAEIIETYVARMVMPRDPVGDALHLAVASYTTATFSSHGTVAISRMRTSSSISGESTRCWDFLYQPW